MNVDSSETLPLDGKCLWLWEGGHLKGIHQWDFAAQRRERYNLSPSGVTRRVGNQFFSIVWNMGSGEIR